MKKTGQCIEVRSNGDKIILLEDNSYEILFNSIGTYHKGLKVGDRCTVLYKYSNAVNGPISYSVRRLK